MGWKNLVDLSKQLSGSLARSPCGSLGFQVGMLGVALLEGVEIYFVLNYPGFKASGSSGVGSSFSLRGVDLTTLSWQSALGSSGSLLRNGPFPPILRAVLGPPTSPGAALPGGRLRMEARGGARKIRHASFEVSQAWIWVFSLWFPSQSIPKRRSLKNRHGFCVFVLLVPRKTKKQKGVA